MSRVFLLGAAAISFAACDRLGLGSRESEAAQADIQPRSVSAEALRAAVEDDGVRKFYEARDWQAAWGDRSEAALLEAVEQVETHGLRKTLFVKGALPSEPAEREAALTKLALAYASALADGYVDPTKLREIYTVARPKTDVAAGLSQALAAGKVGVWLGSLVPQTDEYRALSKAFVHFLRRGSVEDRSIRSGDLIKQGDRDPRLPRVIEALATNGYLDPAQLQQADRATYGPAVVQAVQRLQQDYGIDPDGVIGPDTLKALNTGAADRARQLAVNLERLRWLDRSPPATRIDVNTAAAFLSYWRDGQMRDRRRVVVGQPDWETPQLGSPIYQLVANPTWTVPKSIEEDELANKGAAYFRENNMVRRDGFIVQLPGPENSLGLVKFDMKNDNAIYLHDTPAKALFAENERHRSHGCVRVHNALQFAHMIAAADGTLDKFRQAMATGEETFVDLNAEIPVRLMYHSAYVDGGKVQFRTDAYGWDDDVARALGLQVTPRRTLRRHETGDFGP